jgi:hypothetical protein
VTYSYEKTVYVNIRTPVIITCHIHGDFKQLPWAHLQGQGCQKCANTKKPLVRFIKEANEIHGNKYSYEHAVYTNSKSYIIVTCQVHGDFKIRASSHLSRKQGCGKCAGRKTTQDFIEQSKKVHGDRYTYDKTEYKGINSDVIITCKTHGDFIENARDHIRVRGRQKGCPQCGYGKRKHE